mmetsp:Transcript_14036/g.48893  ORF Transcript_14036/g.48893 Transcript_14036/m.48893 type:complete len:201 (+) Transcript_14036:239-841(+)
MSAASPETDAAARRRGAGRAKPERRASGHDRGRERLARAVLHRVLVPEVLVEQLRRLGRDLAHLRVHQPAERVDAARLLDEVAMRVARHAEVLLLRLAHHQHLVQRVEAGGADVHVGRAQHVHELRDGGLRHEVHDGVGLVPRQVREHPAGLAPEVERGAVHLVEQRRDDARVDDGLRLPRRARRDVRQRPRRLLLQLDR